jgi:phosphatidate cytidylyltransferase
MAFNWKTFQTRTLTAIVFAAVMLTGLLWNYWSFFILFSIIHFGCWWEFVKLLKKIDEKKYILYSLLGLIYISMPVLMMIDLGIEWRIYTINNTNEVIYNKLIPCSIIFSIWINDTMAYLIGSFIGKTPFSKISPKKTWEGTLGGIVLAIIVAGIIAWQFDFNIEEMMIIAGIASVAGAFGDLLESKLKRMARVKDSGSLMPGHGGFLDRFDSMLLATPAVWLYVAIFLK